MLLLFMLGTAQSDNIIMPENILNRKYVFRASLEWTCRTPLEKVAGNSARGNSGVTFTARESTLDVRFWRE